MWISATKALELRDACEIALPKLEEKVGEKLDVDNVLKIVWEDLTKFQRPISIGNWNQTDWQGRKKELAEIVPELYSLAVKRENMNKNYTI